MAVTMRAGRVRVRDGSSPPKEFAFRFDGSFQLNVPGVAVDWLTDRGVLPDDPEPLIGAEGPMTASLEAATVQRLSAPDGEVPADFVWGEFGAGFVAANWVSTLGADAKVMAYDLLFDDGRDEILLPDAVVRGNYAEAEDGNKLSLSISCPHPYPTVRPVTVP